MLARRRRRLRHQRRLRHLFSLSPRSNNKGGSAPPRLRHAASATAGSGSVTTDQPVVIANTPLLASAPARLHCGDVCHAGECAKLLLQVVLAALLTTPPSTSPLARSTPPTSSPPVTPALHSLGSSSTATPTTLRGNIFVPAVQPLISTPSEEQTPRPTPPASRRKTLAAGFTVRRSSLRIKVGHRGTPIAKMAEQNLCRRLGIVGENEDITEQVVQEFVDMFKTQMPANKIAALRVLFRLDFAHADAVETALLRHGGQEALELEITADV